MITNVLAKSIVSSVGFSAPMTSITVPNVKVMKAINKNLPFNLSSGPSDLRLALANKNPVTKNRAIENNR